MGRAGTIIKPIAIPSDAPVEHTPTPYAVRQGEDVYAIAKKFNITADELRWSNPDKLTRTDVVRAGDLLQVPPIPGVVVVVKATDTVHTTANPSHLDPPSTRHFNLLPA